VAEQTVGFLDRSKPVLPRLFGTRITVVVKSTSVEFRAKDRIVSLTPDLFVKDGIIVSVGSPPPIEAERLPVFVPDQKERAMRLDKLIKYGLETVMARSFFVKPIVRLSVEGAASRNEITVALLHAGAAEVSAT